MRRSVSLFFFFSSRRRHTRCGRDWSSDVCSSDLRFDFEGLRLGARRTYEVEANWKILGENYSECYHCAPIHPELNRITHYTSGAYTAYFMREPRAPNFNGGFMEFSKDYTSMVWSGYT